VREFGVAPVATTGDTTTLTDPVWDNADRTPDVVQFVRRVETAAHRATVDDVRPQLPALERLWQLDGPAGAVAELVGAGSDVPADEVAGRPPEVTAADLREDPDLRARCRKRLTRLTSPCRGPRRSGRFGSFPRFQRGHRVVDPVAQDQAEPVRKEYADEIAAIYAG
jgi:hypothetical protein